MALRETARQQVVITGQGRAPLEFGSGRAHAPLVIAAGENRQRRENKAASFQASCACAFFGNFSRTASLDRRRHSLSSAAGSESHSVMLTHLFRAIYGAGITPSRSTSSL